MLYLAALLTGLGYEVEHDRTAFEPPVLDSAYTRSLTMLQQRLAAGERYDLMIDLHRDAYPGGSQGGANAVTVGSAKLARLMLLVGKGEGQTGRGFDEKPDWEANLRIAQAVTDAVNAQTEGLCRKVMLKAGRFNQHVQVGCLLVEVGNNRNTLGEALASMPYLADALDEAWSSRLEKPGASRYNLQRMNGAPPGISEGFTLDQRPVGLLDSGLGGISVLGEALRQLPNEDYVYYGDTANAPYGDKTPEEVLGLVHQAVERLIELRCKAIVIACNTATSVSAGKLRQELALPIIGMEPALKPASLLPGEGKILVMATRVTLALPKFHALMAQYGRDAVPVPCPGLMECVERGELEGPQVTALLRQLLGPWLSQSVKAVVLGCTHYPFLRKAIAALFPKETPLIDGNAGSVRQLRRRLEEEGLLSNRQEPGRVTFLSSSEEPSVLQRMQTMLELCANESKSAPEGEKEVRS